MDLGNKTLNNLLSKDYRLLKEAALEFIENPDPTLLKLLDEKSEFLFDFIKEKIVKNLTNAVNKKNVGGLFLYTSVYSEDFRDFIINSFAKFTDEDIKNKFFELLKNGSAEQKTYAILYFKKIKEENAVNYTAINSDFEPLKRASIEFLAELNRRDEFNLALNILNSSNNDFEKLNAVEFLGIFGDKSAFTPIYNYFAQNGRNELCACALLSLKDFGEIEDEGIVLNIFSLLVENFPETVSLNEIISALNGGVFNTLVESAENFAAALSFYLFEKLQNVLNDENYSVDFSNSEKNECKNILSKLSLVLSGFDRKETLDLALAKGIRVEKIIALNITENNLQIEKVLKEEKDNEIILNALYALKRLNKLNTKTVLDISAKTKNKNLKAQIESLIN